MNLELSAEPLPRLFEGFGDLKLLVVEAESVEREWEVGGDLVQAFVVGGDAGDVGDLTALGKVLRLAAK